MQTTRAVQDESSQSIFLSPDGTRYVVMLIRGDIARNRIEAELISGGLDSLDAAQSRTVTRLFTSGLGRTPFGEHDLSWLTVRGNNPPVWLDNEHVAFLWEDDRGLRQVWSAAVITGEVRQLTFHPTDVVRFGAHGLQALLYDAAPELSLRSSQELLQKGFVVSSPDAISLMRGLIDGTGHLDHRALYERFISVKGNSAPRRLEFTGGKATLATPALAPLFSPDGKFALVDDIPATVPTYWSNYVDEFFQLQLTRYQANARQLFVVDVDRATTRALWDAPLDLQHSRGPSLIWSDDGLSVLLGPTFLPLRTPTAMRHSVAMVEVEVGTGRYSQVPVPKEVKPIGARWVSKAEIEVRIEQGPELRFEKRSGSWKLRRSHKHRSEAKNGPLSAVRVELRQGLNTPPALYAVHRHSAQERLLLDLNPRLRADFDLGRVEFIDWKDADGRVWRGRLYYPVGFAVGKSYPLVIQTHGYASEEEFSLYGMGESLGPAWSTYMAQPLAATGIAVLQLSGPLQWDMPMGDQLGRTEKVAAGYESAVHHLAAKGMIDPTKVGLMGYSRTGWHVEYALTHSTFPYAAAIVSDNIDGSYSQAMLTGWERGLGEDLNGVPAFGAGLKSWLEHSPAFNVERVRTPLQLQVTDSFAGVATPIVEGWEMFSRLRYLGKPVELYVAPNILRGSHTLQNPGQLLPSQTRALDWWRFWLQGKEDTDAIKAEQYSSWRKLRQLQNVAADRHSERLRQ